MKLIETLDPIELSTLYDHDPDPELVKHLLRDRELIYFGQPLKDLFEPSMVALKVAQLEQLEQLNGQMKVKITYKYVRYHPNTRIILANTTLLYSPRAGSVRHVIQAFMSLGNKGHSPKDLWITIKTVDAIRHSLIGPEPLELLPILRKDIEDSVYI